MGTKSVNIKVPKETKVRFKTKEKKKMCIYGYARVSTTKQNIERQIRNISAAYPTAIIVEEIFTRTSFDRPKWNKLMKIVKAGDTIVFDSVSRMSGNADEGVKVYMELFEKGIELVFLKEPHINTCTYKKAMQNNIELTGTTVDFILEGINKYLKALAEEQIRIAFEQSEKEVQDLHQRTKEGIETARLEGKQIGQIKGTKLTTKKSVEAKEIIMKHNADFNGTLSDEETIKLAGISRNSFYKYKKELKTAAAE